MTDLQQRLQAALGDTYRLLRELGGGGMSRVFLAEETRLGRQVVVKVLPPETGAGRQRRALRARDPARRAAAAPAHRAAAHRRRAAGDLLYYVMPFIAGESLRAKLAREGELPVAEASAILREVVDALSYAHRNGVVHRDIKPDNVLLSDGHAVVTDFGVAKAVSASSGSSSLTSLGVALGTPAYMAPEQAAADPHVDHRADIYAVGALAYEMLGGRPPFTAPTPQAHARRAHHPGAGAGRAAPARRAAGAQRAAHALPGEARRPIAGRAPPSCWASSRPRPRRAAGSRRRARRPSSPAAPRRPSGGAIRRGSPSCSPSPRLAVLGIVYLLVQQLGLPDWVFFGAIVLLLIGLPSSSSPATSSAGARWRARAAG